MGVHTYMLACVCGGVEGCMSVGGWVASGVLQYVMWLGTGLGLVRKYKIKHRDSEVTAEVLCVLVVMVGVCVQMKKLNQK